MATQSQVRKRITNGPSKWELIIEGLLQNKEVEFTFDDLGKVSVRITSVATEGGTDRWIIVGYTVAKKTSQDWTNSFQFTGYYNGKDRSGYYELK